MTESGTSSGWRSAQVPVRNGSIAAQAYGDPSQPSVLLIGAATWSRDWWTDAFCEALADEGVQVLRYDARDTGESSASPVGSPRYTADDLVDDPVAVLDAFDVSSATVAGLSMGGGVAQRLAAMHPDRVDGLVLMSTSPAGETGRELPGPTVAVEATFDDPVDDPDWSDPDSVADWVVENERPYAGPDAFDEAALRRLVRRVWERTPSMANAATNHFVVAEAPATVDFEALRATPVLVTHGSADPLFPLAHGEALAAALDGRLVVLDGVGHQLPPPQVWPTLLPAMAQHARSAGTRA